MPTERVQLHLTQPYKIEVRRHPRVRRLLDDGFRIEQLQRLTDRDVLVTLSRTREAAISPPEGREMPSFP